MAGLSCACELADAGLDVTLVEAKKHLGGRAYSFEDKGSGKLIDNSQHVLLGCCESSIGFLSKIGSLASLDFREEMDLLDEAGKVLKIRPSRLPAPFHLLPSIVRTGYMPAGDKLRLCRVLASVAWHSPAKNANARGYLKALSCSDGLIDRVLEPVIVSALNEEASAASAAYARMVLTKTLLGDRGDYRLGIPSAPLADVIADPASRYLASRGGQVRLGSKAGRLYSGMGRVDSVLLSSGEELARDAYVCAVPPWDLAAMGYDPGASHGLSWRPTLGAHMFFDGAPPRFGPACLIGEPFQWVFNKSTDFGLDSAYVHAVASSADGIVRQTRGDLTYLAMRAAARAAPELAERRLERVVITREYHATFSTGESADTLRPSCATAFSNLFLAGDWTDTRWPATIESAVRSGLAAANAVVESFRDKRS